MAVARWIVECLCALKENLTCEVAIIGGGITGALIAHQLTKQGADYIVLDRRNVGKGSTSTSTELLLYEIDVDLHELIDLVSEDHAVCAYQLCREAICQIHIAARILCDFLSGRSNSDAEIFRFER